MRGGDQRWLLEAFNPFFECTDVTEACRVRTDQAEEEEARAPTLIFRLVPRAARDLADDPPVVGDAEEDADEAAALAQYDAARTRLGLRC